MLLYLLEEGSSLFFLVENHEIANHQTETTVVKDKEYQTRKQKSISHCWFDVSHPSSVEYYQIRL